MWGNEARTGGREQRVLSQVSDPREQLALNATGALWKPAWNAFRSIPVKGQGT